MTILLYFTGIKPHYRSEGPRQGSCRVFGGMFRTIKTITMEYRIEELALNYVNQKNIWYQISVQSCISIREITPAQKAI